MRILLLSVAGFVVACLLAAFLKLGLPASDYQRLNALEARLDQIEGHLRAHHHHHLRLAPPLLGRRDPSDQAIGNF